MNFSTGQNKDHVFSLRLPNKMRKELQEIADKEGVKLGFIFLKAIERVLEEYKQEMNKKNE